MRLLLRRVLAPLAVTAAVVAVAPAAAGAQAMLADSGFRPDPDGFSFENYTDEHPGLDVPGMQRLFGDAVCVEGTAAATCRLTPPARQWLRDKNSEMEGGHCYGMAVTSLRIHEASLSALTFGGPTTFGLAIDGNEALAREIAYAYALQYLDAVSAAQVKRARSVVAALRAAYTGGGPGYTLGLYKAGWKDGHELTPYAVQDMGDGTLRILVYDNNYPGEERYITVDATTFAWRYSGAANPAARQDLYSGNGSSERLEIEPYQPALGVQPCPFCADTARTRRAVTVSNVPDPADDEDDVDRARQDAEFVTVTDADGDEAGLQPDGDLVNEIDGAIVQPVKTNGADADEDAPVAPVVLDAGRAYQIEATGSTKGARGRLRMLSVVGPGWLATVGGLNGGPGDRDSVRVSADGSRVTLVARRGQQVRPRIAIGNVTVRAAVRFGAVPDGTRLEVRLTGSRVVVDGVGDALVIVEDADGRELTRDVVEGEGAVVYDD